MIDPDARPVQAQRIQEIAERWDDFWPEYDEGGVTDGAHQSASLYLREHGRTIYLASCTDHPDAEKFWHAAIDIRDLLAALAAAEAQRAALETAMRELVESWRPRAICYCGSHCDCGAHDVEECIRDVEAKLSKILDAERQA